MTDTGRLARLIPAVLAAALLAASLTACSQQDDPTYAPTSYWATVDNVHECYYIDQADEAYSLIAAGLCPAGSIPTRAPVDWEAEYFAYYSSPAYYDAYVPARYRARYASVTIVHFSTTYRTRISSLSSRAVYRSSTGGTVTGGKVNTSRFTSSHGGSRSSGYTNSRTGTYSGTRSAGRR